MTVDSDEKTTTAWVLRAGCGCISSVSVLHYGSIEQAWAKMVGGAAEQRRAIATGMTLSIHNYDDKLIAEIRDTAVTCDHPPIILRDAVTRIRKLARDMTTWCSPYGVATTYAKRIRDALLGDVELGAPRTTCPFCPVELGEMDDITFMAHIDSRHHDISAGRATAIRPVPAVTPERIATIINEAAQGFARDTADGGWMVAAGRRVLEEVTAAIDAVLAEHEDEQTTMMRRRLRDNMPDHARTHATRARAHQRDRNRLRNLLAGRHA